MDVGNSKTRPGRRTKLGVELERSARNSGPREGRPETADPANRATRRGERQAHPRQSENVPGGVCARVLHKSEDASGVGARAAKARCNDPRLPRGHRQKPRGRAGRAGAVDSELSAFAARRGCAQRLAESFGSSVRRLRHRPMPSSTHIVGRYAIGRSQQTIGRAVDAASARARRPAGVGIEPALTNT